MLTFNSQKLTCQIECISLDLPWSRYKIGMLLFPNFQRSLAVYCHPIF